ncbi:MAG: hypothetical protein WA417_09050, partial [Stellaceae bacterium]
IDLASGFLVAGDRHRRLISAYQHIIQLSATQSDAPAQARTIPTRFSQSIVTRLFISEISF